MVNSSNLLRCVYCLEQKSRSQFNIEHVIQKSMTAGFRDNLTLANKVCQTCNTFFDAQFDNSLAQNTIFGLDRISEGIKPAKSINGFRGRSVRMTTASKHPDLNGVPVDPKEAQGRLRYSLRPHLVVSMRGGWPVRLYFENLVQGIEALDFSEMTGEIKAWAESEEDEKALWDLAKQEFGKRGRSFDVIGSYVPGTVPVVAEVEFTELDFRTFAKIAFNYFVKITANFSDMVFDSCFDDARKFIRYGEAVNYRIVDPIGNVVVRGLLGYETNPRGHFVDLRLHRNDIFRQLTSRVTIFNRFGWSVLLCRDYRGLELPLDCAHFWNVESMRCEQIAGGRIETRDN